MAGTFERNGAFGRVHSELITVEGREVPGSRRSSFGLRGVENVECVRRAVSSPSVPHIHGRRSGEGDLQQQLNSSSALVLARVPENLRLLRANISSDRKIMLIVLAERDHIDSCRRDLDVGVVPSKSESLANLVDLVSIHHTGGDHLHSPDLCRRGDRHSSRRSGPPGAGFSGGARLSGRIGVSGFRTTDTCAAACCRTTCRGAALSWEDMRGHGDSRWFWR